jgi:hypothetical protein
VGVRKNFDLNIEKILENWDLHHAVREIIANALDEQFLTNSQDIEIFKNGDLWIIKDYGRGLRHFHLTQNENKEKLDNPNVVGKFGIGLKDALATLYRKNSVVRINSKFHMISIVSIPKQGFQDIETLHAVIEDSLDDSFVGTEFILSNISDDYIEMAKMFFLKFSGENIIETTKNGQVIQKKGNKANIYINGVKVAEEDNFLFSYNITTITSTIKKFLNRERTNVGRTAYSDSIKRILLSSIKLEVAEIMAEDFKNLTLGHHHDELGWIDVQEHAVKILNEQEKYIFITPDEIIENVSVIDIAKNENNEVIFIPENLRNRIQNTTDFQGNKIVDLGNFVSSYNDSFTFNFIEPDDLNESEKSIYAYTKEIIHVFGGMPDGVFDIKISFTMRTDLYGYETLGCYDSGNRFIVVSQKTLSSLSKYAGVLIHELIHAKTGNTDVTRAFECDLTNVIGCICERLLRSTKCNYQISQDVMTALDELGEYDPETEKILRITIECAIAIASNGKSLSKNISDNIKSILSDIDEYDPETANILKCDFLKITGIYF